MRPAAGICKAKLGDLVHRSPRLDFIHPVAPCLDGDSVAGIDDQLWFFRWIEPAPLYGVLVRRQRVMFASDTLRSGFFRRGLRFRSRTNHAEGNQANEGRDFP